MCIYELCNSILYNEIDRNFPFIFAYDMNNNSTFICVYFDGSWTKISFHIYKIGFAQFANNQHDMDKSFYRASVIPSNPSVIDLK